MDRYDFIDQETGHYYDPVPNMKSGGWMLTEDVIMWVNELENDIKFLQKKIEILGKECESHEKKWEWISEDEKSGVSGISESLTKEYVTLHGGRAKKI